MCIKMCGEKVEITCMCLQNEVTDERDGKKNYFKKRISKKKKK